MVDFQEVKFAKLNKIRAQSFQECKVGLFSRVFSPAHPHGLQEGDERLVALPPHFCQLHVHLDHLPPAPGLRQHRHFRTSRTRRTPWNSGRLTIGGQGGEQLTWKQKLAFSFPLETGGSWRKSPHTISWMPPKGSGDLLTDLEEGGKTLDPSHQAGYKEHQTHNYPTSFKKILVILDLQLL